MNAPLVSVLIPFKNTERFVFECLDSIRGQTYTNWEVLAVDDHSSDASRQLVENMSAQDKRIRLVNNLGNGIIDALRTAYSKSNGQLITRMDADDIMTPNKIRVLVDALSINGRGHLAIGKVKYFSEYGIGDGYARYEEWLNKLTETGDNYSEIYKECVIPSPCWMVFREDLDACSAFESNRYPEDYDLAFRFYEGGLKCIPCNQTLHHWRDYETRTSRISEQYAQNYFLDIKLHYFLKLNRKSHRPLVLWGAGNKGKEIAKSLQAKKIAFRWVCDNPKKIGKEIYGQNMLHFEEVHVLQNPQTIVSVANAEAQAVIKRHFAILGQGPMVDYYFFC